MSLIITCQFILASIRILFPATSFKFVRKKDYLFVKIPQVPREMNINLDITKENVGHPTDKVIVV